MSQSTKKRLRHNINTVVKIVTFQKIRYRMISFLHFRTFWRARFLYWNISRRHANFIMLRCCKNYLCPVFLLRQLMLRNWNALTRKKWLLWKNSSPIRVIRIACMYNHKDNRCYFSDRDNVCNIAQQQLYWFKIYTKKDN